MKREPSCTSSFYDPYYYEADPEEICSHCHSIEADFAGTQSHFKALQIAMMRKNEEEIIKHLQAISGFLGTACIYKESV